jgi:hypothetical protein
LIIENGRIEEEPHLAIGLFMRKSLGFILLILALAGCGSQNKIDDSQVNQCAVSQIGTNGQLISIQSDNVRAAGYDEASMVMTVQFDNGALYEYYNVPTDLWTSFVAAQPHPWSQVGYPRLVQGGIPYKRIG